MHFVDYLLIFSAIPIGILAGALPSISISLSLIILYPFLLNVPFDAAIGFWVVAQMVVFYSASAFALCMGIAGDTSTFPVLSERSYIVNNNLLGMTLKTTAQASAISSFASLSFLILVLYYAATVVNFFIFTYTSAIVISIMLILCLFWKGNNFFVNVGLILSSIIIGNIGYHLSLDKTFLVFDHHWLYGGVPILPVILGMYAIPTMFDAFVNDLKTNRKYNIENEDISIPKGNVSLLAVARGTLMGFFLGLIPMFGSAVSSNATYYAENKWVKTSKNIDKIASSESANNASAISALIPLLAIGVAILPSEIVLLSILEDSGWTFNHVTVNTLFTVGLGVAVSSLVCYLLFVNYILKAVKIYTRYQLHLMILFTGIMLLGIYYQGSLVMQSSYYISVLFLSVIIGFVLRYFNINTIPFIIGFLLNTKSLDIYHRTYSLLSAQF